MKILLVGSSGNLGSAVKRVFEAAGNSVDTTSSADRLALLDRRDVIDDKSIDLIINCAANNNVDSAEIDLVSHVESNLRLPVILAKSAIRSNAKFVTFSSTGCYGDYKTEPYTESDLLRPTTVFHKIKSFSENSVLKVAPNSLILRVGWLFGLTNSSKDFVRARVEEIKRGGVVYADNGQIGNPTSVDAVAYQLLHLVQENRCNFNIYNCVANPPVTRYEYVKAIAELLGQGDDVVKAPVGYFQRMAKVSRNESAINKRLTDDRLNIMNNWIDDLKDVLTRGYL